MQIDTGSTRTSATKGNRKGTNSRIKTARGGCILKFREKVRQKQAQRVGSGVHGNLHRSCTLGNVGDEDLDGQNKEGKGR